MSVDSKARESFSQAAVRQNVQKPLRAVCLFFERNNLHFLRSTKLVLKSQHSCFRTKNTLFSGDDPFGGEDPFGGDDDDGMK